MAWSSSEHIILASLDEVVRSAVATGVVDGLIARAVKRLEAVPSDDMTWEPIPLDLLRRTLPDRILSSWIFVLRAGTSSGAERHPNSVQRMMSVRGKGIMQVKSQLGDPWHSQALTGDPVSPLERRWISIPRNTWHQAVVAEGAHWVVISFHSVAAAELIEERPSGDAVSSRTYLGTQGPGG